LPRPHIARVFSVCRSSSWGFICAGPFTFGFFAQTPHFAGFYCSRATRIREFSFARDDKTRLDRDEASKDFLLWRRSTVSKNTIGVEARAKKTNELGRLAKKKTSLSKGPSQQP